MKITKETLKQIIKEEMQNLKNESYEGIDPDDMTHGEYFVHSGGPAGMEAELDEFSVAIRTARDAGVSPKDILAFVQQVLGDAQSDQVIDV